MIVVEIIGKAARCDSELMSRYADEGAEMGSVASGHCRRTAPRPLVVALAGPRLSLLLREPATDLRETLLVLLLDQLG